MAFHEYPKMIYNADYPKGRTVNNKEEEDKLLNKETKEPKEEKKKSWGN